MELEHRVEQLEREIATLKTGIEQTLLDIQASLPDKVAPPSRWERRAWILALINILLAVMLFANIYLFLPGSLPLEIPPALTVWLRAFWLALAFVWLILQMYPLALLLEQEDRQWQGVVGRSAAAFVRARPGFLVVLTVVVLVVGIVNSVIPAAWILVSLALLVAVGSIASQSVLQLFRERMRAGGKG